MSSGGKKISNRANCVDQMLNLELGFEAAIHHSPEWFSGKPVLSSPRLMMVCSGRNVSLGVEDHRCHYARDDHPGGGVLVRRYKEEDFFLGTRKEEVAVTGKGIEKG